MNYYTRIGLLVLLGLWPKVFIGQNLNDPEQLFVEVMKLAETGDRSDVSKRLDEACLLWIKRGDPEQAARARLQIGDLYRNDKRFDESLNQYRQTCSFKGFHLR